MGEESHTQLRSGASFLICGMQAHASMSQRMLLCHVCTCKLLAYVPCPPISLAI